MSLNWKCAVGSKLRRASEEATEGVREVASDQADCYCSICNQEHGASHENGGALEISILLLSSSCHSSGGSIQYGV